MTRAAQVTVSPAETLALRVLARYVLQRLGDPARDSTLADAANVALRVADRADRARTHPSSAAARSQEATR